METKVSRSYMEVGRYVLNQTEGSSRVTPSGAHTLNVRAMARGEHNNIGGRA